MRYLPRQVTIIGIALMLMIGTSIAMASEDKQMNATRGGYRAFYTLVVVPYQCRSGANVQAVLIKSSERNIIYLNPATKIIYIDDKNNILIINVSIKSNPSSNELILLKIRCSNGGVSQYIAIPVWGGFAIAYPLQPGNIHSTVSNRLTELSNVVTKLNQSINRINKTINNKVQGLQSSVEAINRHISQSELLIITLIALTIANIALLALLWKNVRCNIEELE